MFSVQVPQAVAEHQAVDFLENVVTNLDHEVGTDTDDVTVEGGVVQLAHGQPIRHQGLAPRMAIGKDVSSVEQLDMLKMP